MASVGSVREFIQAWEGGLSRAATDLASTNPAPCSYKGISGYHTNKGVTWSTYKSLAPLLGYTPSCEDFFAMPNERWNAIFKKGYWDTWSLDKMRSNAIAALIVDFSWGSGPTGSFNSIKKYLASKGVAVSSREEAVEAINKLSLLNEKEIFLELINWRETFFNNLNQSANLKGWLRRLKNSTDPKQPSLQSYGLELILKKKC